MEQQAGSGSAYYEIRVAGRLSPDWTDWFSGLTVTYSEGLTVIAGIIPDQAALHGHLALVRDLALTLVSIRSCPPRAP
jgi:hypothetical protein